MQTNQLSHKSPSSAPTSATAVTRKRTGWSITIVIIAVLGLFLLIAGIKGLQIFSMIKAGKAQVEPATTVTSAKVEKGNWVPTLTSVGSIAPVQGATISAELAGMVAETEVESGKPVKKGDILVKLDASSEAAQLRSAQADADLAKADLERARELAQRKVISKAEMDAAQGKFAQKQAAVENMQAIIDKKQIKAPFDGIAGIRQVNPGQMVQVGQRLLELQALDQVFANFSLPQQQLGEVQVGLPVKVTTDAIQDREFEGKLAAIDSAIDPATRSVAVQATLDNADHALRAGMFARVKVILPQEKPTLFIPGTAVSYAPFGNSVFVIEKKHDDKTGKDSLAIRQQFIRTGETRGDFVAVNEGLKEGDEVVSTGVFKMRNGMDVAVDNRLRPKAEMDPKPSDS